ncbi:MAG: hypothetical protein JW881_00765 [Spirochaetales bacterium]|nr:hypothetical protein [Spirochaetales bacterium]
MSKTKMVVFPAVIFFCAAYIFPQSGIDTAAAKTGPSGFRGITLGMHIDEVKTLLFEDPYFDYRGDPDVTFLPVTEERLIECGGNSFVKRAYFQFNNEKLYIIIIVLDTEKLDYYTLYTTLTGKYGESTLLDPSHVVWHFSDVRLSLEKPLSVKYIDIKVFEELKSEGKMEDDLRSVSRERFLEEF